MTALSVLGYILPLLSRRLCIISETFVIHGNFLPMNLFASAGITTNINIFVTRKQMQCRCMTNALTSSCVHKFVDNPMVDLALYLTTRKYIVTGSATIDLALYLPNLDSARVP